MLERTIRLQKIQEGVDVEIEPVVEEGQVRKGDEAPK